MKLADLRADIRPRISWEAMDLGAKLLRAWHGQVLAVWLTLLVPVVLFAAIIFHDNLFYAMLFVWWLKPLLDRGPLLMLAQRLFGHDATRREIVRETLRGWPKEALWALTIGRFDPARSYSMPVRRLEGLKGEALKSRLRVLRSAGGPASSDGGNAVWLTMTCITFEQILELGWLAAAAMFVPAEIGVDWWDSWLNSSEDSVFAWLTFVGYVLTITIIEPFYVAAGFALYLNRRTWLEAWDIEIGFRRLAMRLAHQRGQADDHPDDQSSGGKLGAKNIAGVCLAFVLATSLALAPAPTEAEEHSASAEQTEKAEKEKPSWCDKFLKRHQELEQSDDPVEQALLANYSERMPCEEIEGWYPIETPDEELDDSDNWDLSWLDGLGAFGNALAVLVEVLLWGGGISLIAFIVYWILQRAGAIEIPSKTANQRQRKAPSAVIADMIQADSLPDDIPASARQLWADGDPRAAFSLLYRGALANLIDLHTLELEEASTEQDCLSAVRKQIENDDLQAFFANIARQWELVAWAKCRPSESDLDTLCRGWPEHFHADQLTGDTAT